MIAAINLSLTSVACVCRCNMLLNKMCGMSVLVLLILALIGAANATLEAPKAVKFTDRRVLATYTCNPGSGTTGGRPCAVCNPGYYSKGGRNVACSKCLTGSTSLKSGSTSCSGEFTAPPCSATMHNLQML